jgi:hypothetical protein
VLRQLILLWLERRWILLLWEHPWAIPLLWAVCRLKLHRVCLRWTRQLLEPLWIRLRQVWYLPDPKLEECLLWMMPLLEWILWLLILALVWAVKIP